jgi:hypothetical protein
MTLFACVLVVSISPLSTILLLEFGTVRRVVFFVFVFVFHFVMLYMTFIDDTLMITIKRLLSIDRDIIKS